MQKFVDWLLQRRITVVITAVFFAAFIPMFSGAIVGLQWVWRGPAIAFGDTLLAGLAVSLLAVFAAGGPSDALPGVLAGCRALAIGCIAGAILRAAGGLNLAIQISLLLSFTGVALYTMFGSTANPTFDRLMEFIVTGLTQQNYPAEDIAVISSRQERLTGFFGFDLCMELLIAVLLVSWLLAYAKRDNSFGEQFRALRIGFVLGIPSVLIMLFSVISGATLIHNLFGVALIALMLQGLAFVHAGGHAANWHPLFYVPVYLIGLLFGTYLLFWGILLGNALID